jgi:hypothetical protein
MIDPFAFRKSLREAWVIAKVIRMRLRFSWLLNRNALLEIDGCVFHYHWQVMMAVLVNGGSSGMTGQVVAVIKTLPRSMAAPLGALALNLSTVVEG